MTKTFPVYLKFPNAKPSTRYYRFDTVSLGRTVKNNMIKVSQQKAPGSQDGESVDNEWIVDTKKISDGIKLQGFIERQDPTTAPSEEYDPLPTFNDLTPGNILSPTAIIELLILDFKATRGPFYLYYRGVRQQVGVDQIETDDNSLIKQTSKNGEDDEYPKKIKISINFTVGEFR